MSKNSRNQEVLTGSEEPALHGSRGTKAMTQLGSGSGEGTTVPLGCPVGPDSRPGDHDSSRK